MFDVQRYSQVASAALVRAERKHFTGVIELRIQYRNGIPRRGHVRRTICRVLNREPIADELRSPETEFDSLRPELITDGANSDSEISVVYSFFGGLVVDMKREVLNMLC